MKFAILFFSVFLVSCSTTVKVPEVLLAEGSVNPNEAWKEILAKYVDTEGRVDFAALRQNNAKLRLFLNSIAKNSPTTTPEKFPTKEAKLAFYINAYNACSMYNMIDGETPKALDTSAIRARVFYLRKFNIGGKELSLYQLENDVIRKMGEDKIHFALNCSSVGCPRLPQYPFPASGLNAELTKQAKLFLNDSRNVRFDKAKNTVYLSEIMKWYSEDFLTKAPNIISYVNQFRMEKIPATAKIDYTPYDWAVAAQGPRDTASRATTTDGAE